MTSTRTLRDYLASLPEGVDDQFVSPDLKKVSTGIFITADQLDAVSQIANSALQEVQQGTNITIDNTDPQRPVISATAAAQVNSDWNAVSGAAQILNKPTLGTASAQDVGYFATAAQGLLASTALQPAAIGVSVQAYSSVLQATTASFTTALLSKLNGIASGAEVNVNADWNAVSGDAQILNKPTLGSLAAKSSVDIADINASGTPSATTYLRGDGSWSTPAGGGGGAVDSVNSQTGVVVLDADDISDTSTTHKFTTASDVSKLAGIESGADVTDAANVAAAGAFMTASDNLDDISEGTTNKHFTSTEKTKLSGIASGAEVNVNADWNSGSGDSQILNKPTLGNSSSRNVGTTSGTVAAGDDSRITGAAQKSSNLSDLTNTATAFGNIKQAATTSATGVVELATDPEAAAGTSTTVIPNVKQMADYVAANGGAPTQILIQVQNISSSVSAVDFASGIDATYDDYYIEFHVEPSAISNLGVRTSTTGSSAFASGGSDYAYAAELVRSNASAVVPSVSAGASSILINADGADVAPSSGINGRLSFSRPSAANVFQVRWEISYVTNTGTRTVTQTGAGIRLASAVVDAIRFFMSSGTIENGSYFRLYGVKKS